MSVVGSLDTNILARLMVRDDPAQTALVVELLGRHAQRSESLWVPITVMLELEWVLRGYYRFPVADVLRVFEHLLSLESLTLEDRPCQEQAVAGLRSGLDFADALHHASCRSCDLIASFDDKGLARRIQRLNLQPKVLLPS